jgi:hypothetical protein
MNRSHWMIVAQHPLKKTGPSVVTPRSKWTTYDHLGLKRERVAPHALAQALLGLYFVCLSALYAIKSENSQKCTFVCGGHKSNRTSGAF